MKKKAQKKKLKTVSYKPANPPVKRKRPVLVPVQCRMNPAVSIWFANEKETVEQAAARFTEEIGKHNYRKADAAHDGYLYGASDFYNRGTREAFLNIIEALRGSSFEQMKDSKTIASAVVALGKKHRIFMDHEKI